MQGGGMPGQGGMQNGMMQGGGMQGGMQMGGGMQQGMRQGMQQGAGQANVGFPGGSFPQPLLPRVGALQRPGSVVPQ